MTTMTATDARREFFDVVKDATDKHQVYRIHHRRGSVVLMAEDDKDVDKLPPRLKEKLKVILRQQVAPNPRCGKRLVGDLAGFLSFVLLFFSLFLAGCWPTERVVWSPKGDRALVLADDGLHVCTRDGQLSPVLTGRVDCACWFPDNEHVLLVLSLYVSNWTDLASGLSSNQQNAIAELAEKALAKGRREKEPVEFRSLIPTNTSWRAERKLKMLLEHNHAKEMRALAVDWDENIKYMDLPVQDIVLGTVSSNAFAGGRRLERLDNTVFMVAASPRGHAFAFTAGEWNPRHEVVTGPVSLFVASTNADSEVQEVCPEVSVFFDWSPDGRQLVFARKNDPSVEDELALGWITRHGWLFRETTNGFPVTSTESTVLGRWNQDLVLVPFRYDTRVKWSSKGAIWFAVPSLPAAGVGGSHGETNLRPKLFTFEIGKRLTELNVPAVEDNGGDLRSFSVSPNGEFVGWHADEGCVQVLTVETGETRLVQPVHEKDVRGYCPRTVPSWLPTGELCFAVPTNSPAGSTNRAEIAIWSPRDGSTQCISRTWSKESCGDWLLRTN